MSSDYSNIPDSQLWQLLQENDKAAFSFIYKRHIKSLYNFGLKHTTNKELLKDTIQELFIDIWSKRMKQSEVKHLKVYLIKALRYKLLRAAAAQYKSRTYDLIEIMDPIDTNNDLEQKLLVERRYKLNIQLDKLPKRQREVIYLRYFQNISNDEIGEILNVNYQSVSNLLYRALTKLRSNFKLSDKSVLERR